MFIWVITSFLHLSCPIRKSLVFANLHFSGQALQLDDKNWSFHFRWNILKYFAIVSFAFLGSLMPTPLWREIIIPKLQFMGNVNGLGSIYLFFSTPIIQCPYFITICYIFHIALLSSTSFIIIYILHITEEILN